MDIGKRLLLIREQIEETKGKRLVLESKLQDAKAALGESLGYAGEDVEELLARGRERLDEMEAAIDALRAAIGTDLSRLEKELA